MNPQVRIFENTSDKEVFDPQLGVTIPPHGRVSISTAYHNAPSKQEIVDITDVPERHTPEAVDGQDRKAATAVPGVQGDLKTEVTPAEGGQDAQ